MKRKAAVVGVVVFLVIDVALLLALRDHLADAPSISDEQSAPIASEGSNDEPDAVGRTSLTLSTSGILAKIRRGQCVNGGRPRLELSSDQGKTFEEIALPLLEDVRATDEPGRRAATVRTILMVNVETPEEITVVGSDKTCTARRFDTSDRGRSWTESDPTDVWFVDAAGTGVVSPEGASEPGCGIVALSSLSERNAKVACDDGTILGTDDTGDEWVVLGGLPGVEGMTFQGLRDGFAVAADDDCSARLHVTDDAGGTWEAAGCIDKRRDVLSLVGGPGNLLALVDDEVLGSTDDGETWTVQSPE